MLFSITFIITLILVSKSFSVRTTKDRPLVVYEGYEYRQKGGSSDGQTQFWQCVQKKCPGRAHSAVGSENLRVVTAHKDHEPYSAHLEVF